MSLFIGLTFQATQCQFFGGVLSCIVSQELSKSRTLQREKKTMVGAPRQQYCCSVVQKTTKKMGQNYVRSPPPGHGCAHAMRTASSYETGEVFGGVNAAGGVGADGRVKLVVPCNVSGERRAGSTPVINLASCRAYVGGADHVG